MKHFRKYILLPIVLCAAVSAGFCANLPRPKGWVSDFAGVISESKKAELNAELEALEQKTTVELAVVIVKTLEGRSIEEYSLELAQGWGVGKKGKDNGILFLISVDEKHTRIEVGYGLEGILTDGRCGQILDDYVVPYLKKGDFETAAVSGLSAIVNIIEQEYQVNPESSAHRAGASQTRQVLEEIGSVIFLLFFFGFYLFFPFFARRSLGGFSSYGGGFGGGFGGGGFGGFGGGGFGGGGASR